MVDATSKDKKREKKKQKKEASSFVKTSEDIDGNAQREDAPSFIEEGHLSLSSKTRVRGKKRKGKKDTSTKVAEDAETAFPARSSPKSNSSQSTNKEETNNAVDKQQRYCMGRKPVTDFSVGSTYSGKVVYVKPFGIFIDIGCHSDAFCHVSRLSDEFVESPEKMFQEGDEIAKARVVEVDRRRKRLTVSLQSTNMQEREKQSIEARENRKRARSERKRPRSGDNSGVGSSERQSQLKVDNSVFSSPGVRPDEPLKHGEQHEVERQSQTGLKTQPTALKIASRTDAARTARQEEKRKRKLERRAARRALLEQEQKAKE